METHDIYVYDTQRLKVEHAHCHSLLLGDGQDWCITFGGSIKTWRL